MLQPGDANAEAIEAWNTVLYDKFARFRDVITRGFAVHGEAVLERHPPREGARVLDVGCGFGDTTIAIARRVGSRGEAVGVDAAPRFIAEAARTAAEDGAANARFVVADVEQEDLGGPFDQVYSRFGVMFFASPVAAFRRMRAALAPGGKLSFVVWRRKDENPVFFEPEQTVLSIVPEPTKREDQITCGPGPFSMASPDLVSAQLLAAGLVRPTFERVDAEIRIGGTVDAAIDFALSLGPAGEVMRLAEGDAEAKRPAVTAALRDHLASWLRDDGVYGRSSTWVISATRPA